MLVFLILKIFQSNKFYKGSCWICTLTLTLIWAKDHFIIQRTLYLALLLKILEAYSHLFSLVVGIVEKLGWYTTYVDHCIKAHS